MTQQPPGTATRGDPPATDPPRAPRRTDARLLLPAAATWAAAWLALAGAAGRSDAAAFAAVLAAVGGLGVASVLTRAGRPGKPRVAARVVVAALLCAAGAAASSALRVAALEAGPVRDLAGARAGVIADLVVTGDPRRRAAAPGGAPWRGDTVVVPARIEAVTGRGRTTRVRSPVVVLAEDARWLARAPSERVRAQGRLAPPSRADGTAAVLRATGPPQVLAGPDRLQRTAGRLRAGLRAAVAGLPPAERGLVPGLVVGDTGAALPEVEEDFRTAGLTHLTAVSGANVAIVVGAAVLLARAAGVPGRAVAGLGGLVLLAFVVVARPQPSVLRAGVMGLVVLLSLGTGRRRAALPALAASVVVLVLLDPWLARSWGFALSVLATLALVLLAPGWTAALAAALERHRARWAGTSVRDPPSRAVRAGAAALAVPFAAQAVCAPLVVLLSGQVSLVAVPANVLVAPAVAPATVFGALATAAAPVSPTVAGWFGAAAGWPARWIVGVAAEASDVPYAAVPWPSGLGGALALAAVTVVAVAVGRRAGWRVPVGLLVTGTVVGAAAALHPGWPPRNWVLVACAVGQGDALVLPAGPGAAVVIDTGPDPRVVDRCLDALGVRRVPVLVLTHFHADHGGGLAGVADGRPVGEVVVSPLRDPPDQAARVEAWARAAGVPVRVAAPGETGAAGAASWRVLWPPGPVMPAALEGSAPNNASVALLAEVGGVRLLLAGDLEPAAQRRLRRAYPALRADVLKVPHHGSRLQDPALLTGLRGRVAVVAVGEGNDYGHPAPATLGLLARAGVAVARTDADGDVAVVGGADGSLRIVRRGPPAVAPP